MSTPHQATRRRFLRNAACGFGGIALNAMLADLARATSSPLASRMPQYSPKAKRVIFLFMAGGPSQLELFDYKPRLIELNNQPVPQSLIEGKRFAFMDTSHGTNLLGTRREFKQHGKSGAWVSDLFPHTAKIVDDITLVKS
eukprot:gene4963-6204_t